MDCELLDFHLGNRFGCLELDTLSFDAGGGIGDTPRRFQTIKYTFEVANKGNSNTNVTQFAWNANIGGVFTSEETQSVFLVNNDETVVINKIEFEIDLLFAQEYVVNSTVIATSEIAEECGDEAVHTFSGGLIEFPSQVPSGTVPSSNVPSATPSSSVNPTPSQPVATPQPTPSQGDSCFSDLIAECEPPLGFTDCNSMPLPRTTCLGSPTSLTFRYNAGNCSDSVNSQPPSADSCTDFNGGPPSLGSQTAFVVATDQANADIVYCNASVAPGKDFTVPEIFAGAGVPTNLNGTVYSSAATAENPVQTISFVASCSADLPLFLNDRFGSMQLIAFANEEQGDVDSIVDVNLVFTIRGHGGSTLDSLTSLH
jgi:hypothetical protein